MAIEMLCEFYPGAEGVVEASLVPTLVDKLKTDLDQIKVSFFGSAICFNLLGWHHGRGRGVIIAPFNLATP